MKTNLLAKRIASVMKHRKSYHDIIKSCERQGLDSLRKTSQCQMDKIDAKLIRMLKPHFNKSGATVGEITQEDIDSANSHPIENLFPDAKKGKVCCIFHADKNPSATIGRNNRFKCFSCGASKSVIDCYMKLHGKTFIESVKELK